MLLLLFGVHFIEVLNCIIKVCVLLKSVTLILVVVCIFSILVARNAYRKPRLCVSAFNPQHWLVGFGKLCRARALENLRARNFGNKKFFHSVSQSFQSGISQDLSSIPGDIHVYIIFYKK